MWAKFGATRLFAYE